jgi:hypothetical protein
VIVTHTHLAGLGTLSTLCCIQPEYVVESWSAFLLPNAFVYLSDKQIVESVESPGRSKRESSRQLQRISRPVSYWVESDNGVDESQTAGCRMGTYLEVCFTATARLGRI